MEKYSCLKKKKFLGNVDYGILWINLLKCSNEEFGYCKFETFRRTTKLNL